ncbi:MAG: hypothetical protein SFU86_23705 [Pirellulaceae bacterium]|nr:hypothetical protein [Pirellulaceae bacterium]
MAIDVTCPGCKQRFQVSDKFAGKKGPCPKCKFVITVPEKKDEVVIHAPEQTGPKDSKGVAVLKPLVREEVRLSRTLIGIIVGSVLLVLVIAFVLRLAFPGGTIPPLITIVGAVLLAPPLAIAGYTFLRDDELEPHRGQDLWLRLIAPSVVYPLLWGAFWLVVWYLDPTLKPPGLIFAAIAMIVAIVAGAVTAQASLDLELGQGALHYTLYLVSTVILRLVMGMDAYWNVVK